MSTKEQPPPPVPKLMTLNKGLKLAERWVTNMHGDAGDDYGVLDMESRSAGLGLGAKVLRESQLAPLNDPIEGRLVTKLGVGKKKLVVDEEPAAPARTIDSDDSDEENLDSITNAFAKKRTARLITVPQAQKQR